MRLYFRDDKRKDMSDKTTTSKNDSAPASNKARDSEPKVPRGTSARDVSSGGSVGSKIVTVMCCRSKCVGNPNVVVKR